MNAAKFLCAYLRGNYELTDDLCPCLDGWLLENGDRDEASDLGAVGKNDDDRHNVWCLLFTYHNVQCPLFTYHNVWCLLFTILGYWVIPCT